MHIVDGWFRLRKDLVGPQDIKRLRLGYHQEEDDMTTEITEITLTDMPEHDYTLAEMLAASGFGDRGELVLCVDLDRKTIAYETQDSGTISMREHRGLEHTYPVQPMGRVDALHLADMARDHVERILAAGWDVKGEGDDRRAAYGEDVIYLHEALDHAIGEVE